MKKILTLLLMLLTLTALVIGIALSLKGGEPAVSQPGSVSLTSEAPDVSPVQSEEPSSAESKEPDVSEVSEVSEVVSKKVYSFLACGDNIMHPSVLFGAVENYAENNGIDPKYSPMKTVNYDFDLIYHNIEDLIASADLSYVNQETLVGGGPISGYPKFCSPEAIGYKVKELGFDVINLAHNHMLDSGNSDYLVGADKFFNDIGTYPIGYIADKDDESNITVITVGDVKIAFLAYTESLNGIRLESGSSAVMPLLSNEALIRKQVALAKEQADLVFVSCHWGAEDNGTSTNQVFTYNYEPNQKYVKLFLELNVDVVIGMHSHTLETCEWRNREDGGKTFIAYSLGNFVSGMYYGRNMLGAMLSLNIVHDGEDIYIDSPKLLPTVMHYIKDSRVSSSKSDIIGTDTGFRKNEIFLLEDYSEELAAAHGCHAKDDPEFSTSKHFTYANLIKCALNTVPEEFLPESVLALGE